MCSFVAYRLPILETRPDVWSPDYRLPWYMHIFSINAINRILYKYVLLIFSALGLLYLVYEQSTERRVSYQH